MPTTKHAAIRYQALDRCFRNPYKEFFIEDLIEVCSKAIMDYDGSDEGISRRTIFNDISFMRSNTVNHRQFTHPSAADIMSLA